MRKCVLLAGLSSLFIYGQLRSFDTLLEMTAAIPVKTGVSIEKHFHRIVLDDSEKVDGLTIPQGVSVRVFSNEQKPLFVRFYVPDIKRGGELHEFCLKNDINEELSFRLIDSQTGISYRPGDLLMQKEVVDRPFETRIDLDFVLLPPRDGVDFSKNFKGKLGVSIHDV